MPKKNLTFEQSLARLEEILQVLENGDSDLDGMLKLYEEGVSLIRACNLRLEQAEQSVKMLAIQPDGKAALVDFDTKEDS